MINLCAPESLLMHYDTASLDHHYIQIAECNVVNLDGYSQTSTIIVKYKNDVNAKKSFKPKH